MSLWPALDDTAKDLMIPCYEALRQGKGRSDGLRQPQLQMLRSKEQRHPFYWAAFIQSGEWANLDGKRRAIALVMVCSVGVNYIRLASTLYFHFEGRQGLFFQPKTRAYLVKGHRYGNQRKFLSSVHATENRCRGEVST